MALFLGSCSWRHPSVPPLACAVSPKPQSCLIYHSNLFLLVFPLCWHVTLCGIVIRVAGGCRAAAWIHLLLSRAHLDYQLESNWRIGLLGWWADLGGSGDVWLQNICGSGTWLSAQILKSQESFHFYHETKSHFSLPEIPFITYIWLWNVMKPPPQSSSALCR